MSATPGQKRWLAREMIEAAQAARRHDDLRNSGERCLYIVGWLQAHMTESEIAEFDALVYGSDRAKPAECAKCGGYGGAQADDGVSWTTCPVCEGTGKPTKAQQARFDALKEIGCICCWNFAGWYRVPEVHHITQGMKRLGHDATLPLCPRHHRGLFDGDTAHAMTVLGPSLAHSKRVFVATYGAELELLETVNAMIARRAGPEYL